MRISDWSSDVCSSDLSSTTVHSSGVRVIAASYSPGLTPDLFRGPTSHDQDISVLAVRWMPEQVRHDDVGKMRLPSPRHEPVPREDRLARIQHQAPPKPFGLAADRKRKRLNSSP